MKVNKWLLLFHEHFYCLDNQCAGGDLQSRTKFMKQEIKQNWTGQENFEICFCVIFDH